MKDKDFSTRASVEKTVKVTTIPFHVERSGDIFIIRRKNAHLKDKDFSTRSSVEKTVKVTTIPFHVERSRDIFVISMRELGPMTKISPLVPRSKRQ